MDIEEEEEEQGQDTGKKEKEEEGGRRKNIIETQNRREYRGKLRSTKNKSHLLRRRIK